MLLYENLRVSMKEELVKNYCDQSCFQDQNQLTARTYSIMA